MYFYVVSLSPILGKTSVEFGGGGGGGGSSIMAGGSLFLNFFKLLLG